jgi:hypothetical protein
MGLTTEVYIQYTTFGVSLHVFPIALRHLPEGNVGLLHPVIIMAVPAKFFI